MDLVFRTFGLLGIAARFTSSFCFGLWAYVARLARWGAKPTLKKPDEEEATKQDETTPPTEPKASRAQPSGPPRVIRYHSIPGPWARAQYPNRPEKAFRVPEEPPPYGTVYYVTKGHFMTLGMTGRLEKTPEGHVVKSPLMNPYSPREEAESLNEMRTEAEVYRRLAGCERVPKLIDWDQETCCLTTQFMEHGNLSHYVQGRYGTSGCEQGDPPVIEGGVRRRWAIQAAEALQAVHAVNVIHCDLTPRNFLLDANLDLYLSDFAGSSVDGSPSKVCAGERYVPPEWSSKAPPKISHDVFALGSVLYVIMTSTEPYADMEEEDVPPFFARKEYPDLSQIACGPVIEACWNGTLTTAGQVLDMINKLDHENN